MKFDLDTALLLIFILLVSGKPDIIDGVIYQLTGEKTWECSK